MQELNLTPTQTLILTEVKAGITKPRKELYLSLRSIIGWSVKKI